jgi:tRNA pseudouridine13 synthase
VPTLHYPYGLPQARGIIKHTPEDFKVHEQLGFELSGQGEHLFIEVEKTGLTTFQLIEIIAEYCGVPPKQVGYSGLKDKQAVTRQWLSVQLPGCKQSPSIPDGESYKILNCQWHDKKLRVGVHRYNDFEITVRELSGDLEHLIATVEKVKHSGFANYFGQQRFGVNQDNVAQAIKVLTNRHKSKRLSRQKKSLYLSALRSEIFNQILNQRIQRSIWMQPLQGDLFMLAGSQSMFSEQLNEALIQRYMELDLHCAVSLAGSGESRISDDALAIENQVLKDLAESVDILNQQKVKNAYRPNRSIAHELQIEFSESSVLKLKVRLEKGVFLTTLLSHLLLIDDMRA